MCKKPTQLEIDAMLEALRQRNIEVLTPYVNAQTSTRFKCTIDQNEWTTRFDAVKRGGKCPKCVNHYTTWGIEELERRAQILQDRGIEMIGDYKGATAKIEFNCVTCQKPWTAVYDSVFRGTGCPRCRGRILDDDDFNKLKSELTDRGIELLGTYKGIHANYSFKCLVLECSNVWTAGLNTLSIIKRAVLGVMGVISVRKRKIDVLLRCLSEA